MAMAGCVSATTVTLSGPISTDDATIYSNAPTNNAGGGDTNRAGNTNGAGVRRTLIRFDLSAIPTSAAVSTASLQMTVNNVPGSPFNTTHTLYILTNSWV